MSRALLSLAALALAAGLAGCEADGGVDGMAPPELRRERIPPDFQPAFDALRASVEAGEDELARRILAGILARRPDGELAELAGGYRRILDGRALVRSLELRLESESVEGSAVDHRLVLLARHSQPQSVSLQLPPGTLMHSTFAIDALGNESRRVTTHTSSAIKDLTVGPGQDVRLVLLDYELGVGGALAVRERWTLALRSGQVRFDERGFPAQEPSVAPAQGLRLASYLPQAPVEPAELVRYVGGEIVSVPPLIERAVRIDSARREEALDLLTPVVERLAEEDPERLADLAPALRWLARSARPGNKPEAWVAWLRARREAQLRKTSRPRLDLPSGVLAE